MKSVKHKIFDWVMPKLSANSREQIFRSTGQSLGVKSFTCEGEWGVVEGNIKDRIVHGYYLRNKTWAPWLQNALKNIVFSQKTGTFVDIGANIGLTVIPIASAREIKCIAFEPEAMNYALLKRNIAYNGLESRIQTFNLALFSSDGELEFELSEDNMGDHRVKAKSLDFAVDNHSLEENRYGEALRTITKVKARRLDGVAAPEDLQRPLAVKLDVQGSEVKVFEGGTLFFRSVDYLFVEFWPYGIKRMGDSPNVFVEFIRQFPWGAIYDDTSNAIGLNLKPIEELLPILNSKSQVIDTGHLDLILARHQT